MINNDGFTPIPSIVPGSSVIEQESTELVKKGHMFIAQKVFIGLAIDETTDFLIDLSAVDATILRLYEIKYAVSQGKAIGTFYEKGNYAGGTIVPIFNRNENNSQVAKLKITINPVGTTVGAEGQSYLAGGEAQGNNLAGGNVGDAEFITEVNTGIDRLLRIVHSGGSGDYDLSIRLIFAEIP